MEVERSLQHIHLGHEQLLALVRKAFPHCGKLDSWKILHGGALNTTYQFQIDSKVFVLRLYARDRSLCKTEKAIHRLIDGHVSTPKLIYADDSYEPWAYSIFEFVSGIHLPEVSEEHKIPLSQELGALLASIHSFKLPKAGLFGNGIAIAHPYLPPFIRSNYPKLDYLGMALQLPILLNWDQVLTSKRHTRCCRGTSK